MMVLKKILPKFFPNKILLQIRLILAPKEKKAKRKSVLKNFRSVDPKIPEIQEALKQCLVLLKKKIAKTV